jgi:hypothetical protein
VEDLPPLDRLLKEHRYTVRIDHHQCFEVTLVDPKGNDTNAVGYGSSLGSALNDFNDQSFRGLLAMAIREGRG